MLPRLKAFGPRPLHPAPYFRGLSCLQIIIEEVRRLPFQSNFTRQTKRRSLIVGIRFAQTFLQTFVGFYLPSDKVINPCGSLCKGLLMKMQRVLFPQWQRSA